MQWLSSGGDVYVYTAHLKRKVPCLSSCSSCCSPAEGTHI